MRANMLFYVVFLSQVLLLSFYLPRTVLNRARHIVATYPPSTHPRLYPAPIASMENALRNYRNMNLFALLIGLALVFIGFYAPSEEMLGWDSLSVLTLYMLLQYSPLLIASTSGFVYFNLRRKTDGRTIRRAEMRPRRLVDFVSPAILGLAAVVYVAFVLLVLYMRRFDYPWFGGYWNIFGVTVLNLFFAAVVFVVMYGKRKDPWQANADRMRQIETSVKTAVYSSILWTSYIALAVIIHAVDLENLTPVAFSLCAQILAVASFRALRIDNVNFEVYREDPGVSQPAGR